MRALSEPEARGPTEEDHEIQSLPLSPAAADARDPGGLLRLVADVGARSGVDRLGPGWTASADAEGAGAAARRGGALRCPAAFGQAGAGEFLRELVRALYRRGTAARSAGEEGWHHHHRHRLEEQ